MLQILSASLRLSALRLSSSPLVYRPCFYSESSSESTSPVAGLGASSKFVSSPSHTGLDSSSVISVASSSVGLGALNYTIAILSDKPDLRKLQDRLLSSSLRAVQSLPQLKHSSSEVKRAFLIWYVYVLILKWRLKVTQYLELAQAHTEPTCIAQPVYFKGIIKAAENTLEAFISFLTTRGFLPSDAIATTQSGLQGHSKVSKKWTV